MANDEGINLNDYISELIPSVAKQYFEENRGKILSEISGRIVFELHQSLDKTNREAVIIINHKN